MVAGLLHTPAVHFTHNHVCHLTDEQIFAYRDQLISDVVFVWMNLKTQ